MGEIFHIGGQIQENLQPRMKVMTSRDDQASQDESEASQDELQESQNESEDEEDGTMESEDESETSQNESEASQDEFQESQNESEDEEDGTMESVAESETSQNESEASHNEFQESQDGSEDEEREITESEDECKEKKSEIKGSEDEREVEDINWKIEDPLATNMDVQIGISVQKPNGDGSQGIMERNTLTNLYKKFQRSCEDGGSFKNCIICLSGFEDNETVRQLPCKHLLHVLCVSKWFFIDKRCPFCRMEIEEQLQNSDFLML